MNDPFIVSLVQPRPIPGGGGAAAHAACVALALLEKIVRLEIRRDSVSIAQVSFWNGLLERVSQLSAELTLLRDEDGQAYLRMSGAKGSKDFEEALEKATDCPIGIMKKTRAALDCVSEVATGCKRHLLSDLLVVCELLHGANQGAYHIASANFRLMKDSSRGDFFLEELNQIHVESSQSFHMAKRLISSRLDTENPNSTADEKSGRPNENRAIGPDFQKRRTEI